MGNWFNLQLELLASSALIRVRICPGTFRVVGLKVHSAVTKPLISRKNQNARLTFAEEHVVWTDENWSKVHFSDESSLIYLSRWETFCLVSNWGKTEPQVRKKVSERLRRKCLGMFLGLLYSYIAE